MSKTRYEHKIKPYGNYVVKSPSGVVMFRCDDKKANWYLSRGLAAYDESLIRKLFKFLLPNQVNPIIRLTFEPNGLGNNDDSYYLKSKKNRCVVCGSKKYLTRHHCVPHRYRKHFPDNIKNNSSHDILILCEDCHWSYERKADDLKTEIVKEYKAPINVTESIDKDKWKVSRYAHTLLTRGDQIPLDRQNSMIQDIAVLLGRPIAMHELPELSNMYQNPACIMTEAKFVVEHCDDIMGFIIRWRLHFIEMMKPEYMPEDWDIHHVPRSLREKQVDIL